MKALVVDDSINDRILLSKVLKIAGFEVMEACNGVEALEKAGKETPDIIISDVMMREMDGFMLLRNLKKDSKTKGLGLAICKQIVELHGGTITADSKYGEGSRFTFIIPLKGIKAVNK